MQLDGIDRRLIAALEATPRAGMLQLARDLGVARNTAQAHLDRLMAAGVITGFGPDVDLHQAGFGVAAWVTLEIAQGRGAAVDEHLVGVREVVEAYMTTGTSDLLCRVVARDNDHLAQVINRIIEVPGVNRTTTALVLATRIAPRFRHLLTDGPERPGGGAAPSGVPGPERPAGGAAKSGGPGPERPGGGAAPSGVPGPERPGSGAAKSGTAE